MSGNELNPSVCRICGEKDFLVDILSDENYHLFGKLKEIEGVIKKPAQVESFDELFKFICRGCEHALEGFYEFRSKIRKMRRKLTKAAMTGRIMAPPPEKGFPIILAEIHKDQVRKTQLFYGNVIQEEGFPEEEPTEQDGLVGQAATEESMIVEEIFAGDNLEEKSEVMPEPEFIMMDYMEEVESSGPEDEMPFEEFEKKLSAKLGEMKKTPVKGQEQSEEDVEEILSRILEKANKKSPGDKTLEPVKKIVQNILEKTASGESTDSLPRKKGKFSGSSSAKLAISIKIESNLTPQRLEESTSSISSSSVKKCRICGRAFALRSNYENHMKIHQINQSPGNYKCSFCDRVYKSRLNWEIHELTHKTDEEGTEEQIQELRARRSAALAKSMKKLSKTQTVPNVGKNSPPMTMGGKCKTCGQSFKNSRALRAHERGHSNEEKTDTKFRCIFCMQEFRSRGLMRFHQAHTHLNVEM
ncbi:PR domain zinc finger protein 5-like [Lutzomyia longipalpis]|uniref:Putative c2h2-type zn-finger protein n=1 Tax=Lutzomyia longipalpis TaxID=7200 RepID=A0A1B0CGC9_LUTLO|nr:PR domain zinc finger protein 5-like [Lutzomyia longipalpis]